MHFWLALIVCTAWINLSYAQSAGQDGSQGNDKLEQLIYRQAQDLASMMTTLITISSRQEERMAEIETQIANIETSVQTRMENMETRLTNITTEVGNLKAEVTNNVQTIIANIGDQVANVSAQIVDVQTTLVRLSTVNLASGKPAFQKDMVLGGLPTRGVDGNRNGEWDGASCTLTNNHPQAWWAVDLGKESQISRVSISNRADCCSERLSNFQIGATNTSPQARAPAIGNYPACAHVGDALGAGETRSITCNAKGRYVIVQLKGRNYLTLCEVEVYGAQEVC